MKKIVIANWKANPDDKKEVKSLISKTVTELKKIKNRCGVVFCPPSTYLDLVGENLSTGFILGAQNISQSKEKESTGEVTGEILKNLGVKYVIVGHSERRALGETSDTVALKLKEAVSGGFTPILCFGERERDEHGNFFEVLERQIKVSLSKINSKNFSKVILAYEPVWAIGRAGKVIAPQDLHQMYIFIKRVLISHFGKKFGEDFNLIYGGSVDLKNAKDLMDHGNIKGFLVGRASLNEFSFAKIVAEVSSFEK